PQFENLRLFNDLTFSGATGARQVSVLDQVLWRTPLRLPPLLMLGSDPDFQQAMESASTNDLRDPVLLKHAIAASVAVRDMNTAQLLVRDAPDAAIALPGLREYVEQHARAA